MRLAKIRLLSLLSFLLPAAAVAQQDFSIAYSEPVQFIAEQNTREATGGLAVERALRFNALDRRFDLSLTSNMGLFSPEFRERAGDGVMAYRGTLDGVPGSWARIVISNGVSQGVIWDGREMFALEPAEQGGSKIFRLSDLIIEPGAMSCSSGGSNLNTGRQFLSQIENEIRPAVAEAQGATLEIEVGMVSDFEFNQRNLVTGPEAAIIARMNIVDGIFSEQVGVQLTLSVIEAFDTASDPFTDEREAGLLLDELVEYRRNNTQQSDAGLTHLFTGRDLEGSTAGIAYIGALCSFSFGTGLTQATRTPTMDSLIAAHEFGHNFGAEHDGEDGSVCEAIPEDFLMAPSVNGSDQFSDCSLVSIAAEIGRSSCLAVLSDVDIAVTAPAGPSQALMGESGTVEFEVASVGSAVANNVTLDVQVISNAVYDSISTTVGSCNDVAGGAQCTLGTMAAGSVVGVTVAATSNAPIDVEIEATVDADDDAGVRNNVVSNTIEFQPVADVQVATASGSVAANSSVTLSANVENLGNQLSVGLVLTVQPATGLRIDSADWSRGTCSVTGNTAECQPTNLAGGSSDSLQLSFTGESAGNRSYTVTAAATTADTNQANNVATGQVNVTTSSSQPPAAPPADSGGGGGGAVDWWLLALLATPLIGLRRRLTAVGTAA